MYFITSFKRRYLINFSNPIFVARAKNCIFVLGKSCATSSCRSPQGGNAAGVGGCSGVIQSLAHFNYPLTKIVFVTGASSGLGKSTATFLAQKGYTVIGTCRDPKKYPAPDSYSLWPLDLNDSKSIVRCVQRLEKEYGRVDVLINNTGKE